MNTLRILGIDPGLRLTGFGVIEKVDGKMQYVASGVIKTASGKTTDKEALPARLKIILDGLFEVIDTYQPSQVAIEKVFVNVIYPYLSLFYIMFSRQCNAVYLNQGEYYVDNTSSNRNAFWF